MSSSKSAGPRKQSVSNSLFQPQSQPQPATLATNNNIFGAPTNSSSSAPTTIFPPFTPDPAPVKDARQLCVRHRQMANQNVNEKLQRSLDSLPFNERAAITNLWSTFSGASHSKRKIILEGILTMCCFSQLSHISDSLNHIIRIDPFSLLPREVSLRILGYLDAMSLGRAAQVSRSWKALADDDLLWRRMCGQHIDRKCEKCGWGLPLLERRRLKVELSSGSPAVAVGVGGHEYHSKSTEARPSKVMTRAEAMGRSMDNRNGPVTYNMPTSTLIHGSNSGKRATPEPSDISESSSKKRLKVEDGHSDHHICSNVETTMDLPTPGTGGGGCSSLTREVRLTRPWKSVYTERLIVERNWRKGRFSLKTLRGHTDGVMCLQYHTALTSPSYPVLITGSWDHTARVWNLDTGEEVRVLRGHTRAVRAIQFDQMLLFTGSMDGTVRMWNWRAGECLRVLEGHSDGVVALNYNGYLLATGSADSTCQVWNFRTGGRPFTLRGHDEWVNSVVIWDGKTSPGDLDPTTMPQTLARGRANCSSTISAGVAATGATNPAPTHTGPDIDPGTMLFSASDDGTVKLWDLVAQVCIRTFNGHKGQIQSLKVIMTDLTSDHGSESGQDDDNDHDHHSHDHRYDYSQSSSAPYGASALGNRNSPLPPTAAQFTRASQSPPRLLAPSSSQGSGEVFDGVGHSAGHCGRGTLIEARAYIHDDHANTNASGSLSGNGNTRPRERAISENRGEKRPVLVTGSLDGTVRLWDVDSGRETHAMFGHIEGVWAVDVDALRIASASHDRTIKVWDKQEGNCVQTLVGHRGAVTSLQLSDDLIVSGSDDGDVLVWSFGPDKA